MKYNYMCVRSGEDQVVTDFVSECDIRVNRDDVTRHDYEFDRVFGPESAQSEVFDAVSALIMSCLDGYNVCTVF